MSATNIRDVRKNLSALLEQVERGEEVIISRRGKPVARLVNVHDTENVRFPSRADLRAALPAASKPAGELLRDLRDEERF
ncbi:MAG: type II toxin-antitoxin system prevent-host-death family antitoxin [Gammaproteobacteria bacterium]|nr:type II toxin-antitoxin system prevent-host-death family antitoxin [Gammaproteobacteria bacterium]